MTWSELWIFSGVLGWVLGWIRVGKVRQIGLPIDKAFVRPPFIIYLACGLPRARNIPKGVMAVSALGLQLVGLLWFFYGITYSYWPIKNQYVHGTILCIGIVLILIYCWTLYKRSSVDIV